MYAVETKQLRRVFTSTKKEPGVLGSIMALVKPNKVDKVAVKGIDLQIAQGEVVGFLGPNGAGKTTTLKMLSGILFPTSGEATVLGYEPWKRDHAMLRRISLVMGNKQQLWWDLPAWDSFMLQREIYEIDPVTFKKRLDNLIEVLGIERHLHVQVRKLSLGERMKCELVAALVYAPEVVFLDEPTLGLDVVSQKRIREFLLQLHREDGCTIMLTSHYMQDVEELCDRVIIIDQGEMKFDGTLASLSGEYSKSKHIKFAFDNEVDPAELARYGSLVSSDTDAVTLDVPREQTARVVGEVLTNFAVRDVSIEDIDIEDVIRDLFSNPPA